MYVFVCMYVCICMYVRLYVECAYYIYALSFNIMYLTFFALCWSTLIDVRNDLTLLIWLCGKLAISRYEKACASTSAQKQSQSPCMVYAAIKQLDNEGTFWDITGMC